MHSNSSDTFSFVLCETFSGLFCIFRTDVWFQTHKRAQHHFMLFLQENKRSESWVHMSRRTSETPSESAVNSSVARWDKYCNCCEHTDATCSSSMKYFTFSVETWRFSVCRNLNWAPSTKPTSKPRFPRCAGGPQKLLLCHERLQAAVRQSRVQGELHCSCCCDSVLWLLFVLVCSLALLSAHVALTASLWLNCYCCIAALSRRPPDSQSLLVSTLSGFGSTTLRFPHSHPPVTPLCQFWTVSCH